LFIVYIYDLNAKDKKKFNRTKRLFYYHLNKLQLNKEYWKSKSALCVELKLEKKLDLFFRRFNEDVVVYKIYTKNIEQLI
jgi:hypothetical protein